MATKKTASTALTKWDEELAKRAQVAAKMEAHVGGQGQYFSIAGGILSFNDQPIAGNEMAVVIVDAVLENAYYEHDYDPKADPEPPVCFALGREEPELAPHEASTDKQHDRCKGCPQNEFGTARRGRGKACKNTRRLAMLPAGRFLKDGTFEAFDDPAHYEGAGLGLLKVPVTSLAGYAGWVKQVADTLHRPPLGVFCRVAVIKDPERQVAVTFETLGKVPDEVLPALFKRADDAEQPLMRPYEPLEERPVKGPARGKAAPAKRARKF